MKQIDYQQWRKQLLTAIETSPDNGLFAFDLRLDEFYKRSWHESLLGDVNDKYAWALKRFYNQEAKIGNIYITIFEPTDNNWKRSDLNWLVKGYGIEEVVSALQDVGFTEINYYNQEDIAAATEKVNVVYFVARKR